MNLDTIPLLNDHLSINYSKYQYKDGIYNIAYTPLTLVERKNIENKYSLVTNDDKKSFAIFSDVCLTMLSKANSIKNEDIVNILPKSILDKIYSNITIERKTVFDDINKLYEENKTKPIKQEKHKDNPLNVLSNMVSTIEKGNIGISDLNNFTDLSYFVYQIGLSERIVREANEYEANKSKRGKSGDGKQLASRRGE